MLFIYVQHLLPAKILSETLNRESQSVFDYFHIRIKHCSQNSLLKRFLLTKTPSKCLCFFLHSPKFLQCPFIFSWFTRTIKIFTLEAQPLIYFLVASLSLFAVLHLRVPGHLPCGLPEVPPGVSGRPALPVEHCHGETGWEPHLCCLCEGETGSLFLRP